jgi:hypothetical protein
MRVMLRASSHVLYLLSFVESTEPTQVYVGKLDFVSEKTIKDIIIIEQDSSRSKQTAIFWKSLAHSEEEFREFTATTTIALLGASSSAGSVSTPIDVDLANKCLEVGEMFHSAGGSGLNMQVSEDAVEQKVPKLNVLVLVSRVSWRALLMCTHLHAKITGTDSLFSACAAQSIEGHCEEVVEIIQKHGLVEAQGYSVMYKMCPFQTYKVSAGHPLLKWALCTQCLNN